MFNFNTKLNWNRGWDRERHTAVSMGLWFSKPSSTSESRCSRTTHLLPVLEEENLMWTRSKQHLSSSQLRTIKSLEDDSAAAAAAGSSEPEPRFSSTSPSRPSPRTGRPGAAPWWGSAAGCRPDTAGLGTAGASTSRAQTQCKPDWADLNSHRCRRR